jgi:hypothetical protein
MRSANPYQDLAHAVAEFDTGMQRLASALPRHLPEWNAVMDLCRITGNALQAVDRILAIESDECSG